MKGTLADVNLQRVRFVARNMRTEDYLECQRSTGRAPSEVLVEAIDLSEYSGVILLDDEPANVYGVVKHPDGVGIPWSMSTYVADRSPREFVRLSLEGIGLIKERYDRLFNFVDASYTRAIKWLKLMGFTVGEPQPYGVLQMPFRPFWWRRDV